MTLLQQPGSFEGFPRIEKGPNPNRLAVLEFEQVGPGVTDPRDLEVELCE
jgi:hypothetical protein